VMAGYRPMTFLCGGQSMSSRGWAPRPEHTNLILTATGGVIQMISPFGDKTIGCLIYRFKEGTKMKNMKLTLLFIVVAGAALLGALMLGEQNQDIRNKAYFAGGKLFLLPADETVKRKVGEMVPVHVMVESTSAKVDSVKVFMCYEKSIGFGDSNSLADAEDDYILIKKDNGFSSALYQVSTQSTKECLDLTIISNKSAESLKSGTFEVATVNIPAKAVGSGTVSIVKDKSAITGDNPSSATDKNISISSVAGLSFEIGSGGTVGTGGDSVLNMRVSFANVGKDVKCAVGWPLKITVLSGSESKTYTGIKFDKVTSDATTVVYEGSLVLTDFKVKSNVAVFVKGPKSLQMKYGIQNQNAAYNQAGGALVLTDNASTSPMYNFVAYPMLQGDVTGATAEVQDGWIDGLDFSFVKQKALAHETVAEGGYLLSDLNGDCQANSNDINVLKLSLNQKQEEVY